MNVIIYARGNDKEKQINHCNAYAADGGHCVRAVCLSLEEVETEIMAGNIDAVIVVCPTRITRKMAEIISFEKLLSVFDAKLIIAPNYKGEKKQ